MTLHKRIRGIALNDVGYDDINNKDGVRYSDYIGQKYKPNAYTTPKPTTSNTRTSTSDYNGQKNKTTVYTKPAPLPRKTPGKNGARKKILLVFHVIVNRQKNFYLISVTFPRSRIISKIIPKRDLSSFKGTLLRSKYFHNFLCY